MRRGGEGGPEGTRVGESVGRGAFSAFVLSSFRLSFLNQCCCTPALLSIRLNNQSLWSPFPTLSNLPSSPPSLLSLKNIIVTFPSLSLSLFVEEIRYLLWNSCRLEITFNRGESRVLLSRESGFSQSFSLVFDLIGGYKSGTSLSFSLFRCLFLSERTTLFWKCGRFLGHKHVTGATGTWKA